MTDTVAYICVIVPVLFYLMYRAWMKSDGTLKDWAKVFACAVVWLLCILAFWSGLVHFLGGLESSK